jgi:polysaccharide export outer membrane protein
MHARWSCRTLRESQTGLTPMRRDRVSRSAPLTASRICIVLSVLLAAALTSGCYVPLRSTATPAACLPDVFRTPSANAYGGKNLSSLVAPKPLDYMLGPDDALNVTVRGLTETAEAVPMVAQIMGDGTIALPLVGEVDVNGMNLADAQRKIDAAYSNDLLVNPRVSVSLASKATYDVTILGEVTTPGVYELPRYQNDVAHAIGLAGGLSTFAADMIKIHRRVSDRRPANESGLKPAPLGGAKVPGPTEWIDVVIQIPLRGGQPTMMADGNLIVKEKLTPDDVTLRHGDVLDVPRKPDPVFFVVGPLSGINAVNFTVSDRDRQLGNAFILPDDRDIDVVTAVAMAGYIDPIESPSTVTVHRSIPGRPPMLIRVDLIDARYSWQENIYVQAGDIIYLNPDAAWWWRRTFDNVVPELITIPYAEALARWISPFGVGN